MLRPSGALLRRARQRWELQPRRARIDQLGGLRGAVWGRALRCASTEAAAARPPTAIMMLNLGGPGS